jgi:glycosyltransferase involved in cell wall biosynthesis
MKLSVVIPCLNAAATIGVQLEALARQDCPPWEIIVADNGSKDESVAVAQGYKDRLPRLRVVDAHKKRGAAHARNVGAAAATGHALAFVDADDEVDRGWVRAMRAALSKHDFVASRMDFTKLNPSWMAKNRPQAIGLQKIAYPPYLYHAGGSGLGVKRSLHFAVHGFDESLLALEDTDYCFRLQLLGVEFRFVPHAIVHIQLRRQVGALFRQSRMWAQYNVLMYKRYRQDKRLPHAWHGHLSKWITLVRCAPALLYKESRAGWMSALGWQVGLLQGAIRYRVAPPNAYKRASAVAPELSRHLLSPKSLSRSKPKGSLS